MSDELLTVAEAAKRLRLSTGTVYRHVASGVLGSVRLGSGPKPPVRIPEDEIDRFASRIIGSDVADRASRIVELRGADATDADEYIEALRAAGYAASVFADRVERMIRADVDRAERDGYFAQGAAPATEAVDVEAIVLEELKRLSDPLPPAVARLGASGIGEQARRLLRDKGIVEYDATTYREAVRQAIQDAKNPKRRVK